MIPLWLFFSILTLLFWGWWGLLSAKLSGAFTGFQLQALSALGLIPSMVILGFSKNLRSGANWRRGAALAFLAGILACGGNIAYFDAVRLGGKASAVTPLTALYPLTTILLAVVFLKEWMSAAQYAGLILSLAGIYLLNVESERGIDSDWLLYALCPILLWGVSALLQKISTQHASIELATLGFFAAFFPVGAGIVLVQPFEIHFPSGMWGGVFLLGLFFGLGNLTLMAAYSKNGKASIVTPLCGLYPGVTVPLAIWVLGEKVSPREWMGIVVSLLAVVALSMEKKSPPEIIQGAQHAQVDSRTSS